LTVSVPTQPTAMWLIEPICFLSAQATQIFRRQTMIRPTWCRTGAWS